MKRLVLFLMVFTFFVAMGGVASAVPTIDGNFGPGYLSDWEGCYSAEDTDSNYSTSNDYWSNYYLGPGYGGQDFDVEYLGLYVTEDTVYFALQTGFDLENGYSGWTSYYPGDFALDVNDDGDYEYAIDFSASGTTATFKLFKNPNWKNPRIWNEAGPYEICDGSYVGKFYGVFNDDAKDAYGNSSYVLEASFSRDLLGGDVGNYWTLHWTMSCGNDVLEHTTPVPTPEPATMLLFGTGLIGLAGLGRKKLKKR